MARIISTPTIILKTWPFGENHKGVTLLSPDLGLIDAFAYGAGKGKGKLSAASALFSLSAANLYHNPVKGTYKITDMEVQNFFEGIRSDIQAYYTACFYSEVVRKTLAGGGDYSGVYNLMRSSLEILNNFPGQEKSLGVVQFIWRFLSILGLQPDIEACVVCGSSLADTPGAAALSREQGFSCSECFSHGEDTLSPGCIRYLRHTAGLSLEKAAAVSLEKPWPDKLKKVLIRFMVCIIETPLQTVDNGYL